jgi:hypothetical protein
MRYRIPTPLRDDVEALARRVGLHGGEFVAIALVRMIQELVPKWNEEATRPSQRLPTDLWSLRQNKKSYTLATVMQGLRELDY